MDTDCDKKIAVTGPTGLVGSHLVAELLRSGRRSIVLPARNRASLDKLYKTLEREKADHFPAAFDIRETALENTAELTEAFRGVDTVFHCAAAVSLGGIDSAEIIRTNVGITKSVVDAALGAGVVKLIFVSSVAALGGPREDAEYVDEMSLMYSTEGATGYSASKFLSEKEVRRGEAGGLKVVIVNPALVLGIGDGRSGSSIIIPLLSRGIPFYTEGVTAFVDVVDVARALAMLAESGNAMGERFLLSADNVSFRDLISYGNKAAGKRPPFIRIGRIALAVAGKIDALLARATRRNKLVTPEMIRYLTTKNYYCGDKIKKTITFEYTPVRQSVERLVKQYLNETGR